METFEIKDNFYLNKKHFKIISGGVHYFRIVPEYWRDRLEKLKALGCNTVETYVAWNVHEPKKGEFCFEGMYDIKKFLEIAKELNLYVIIRPSPYICAEWEFGGLPAWLITEDNIEIRSASDIFFSHLKEYYEKLYKILRPMQINYGGPIIMMQVENEYGYFGDSKKYLEALKKIMIEFGTTVPLVTSDGPTGEALRCGSVKGALPTGNFGSGIKEKFDILKKYTDGGPLMCMEYWIGWFDYWGSDKHMTTSVKDCAKGLDEILECGHVNIYMFIGGTNFGFMNGANYYDELTPDVTSYDYDALLTESGDYTQKYWEFKKVISKYVDVEKVEITTKINKIKYGEIKVIEKVGLFESLDDISKHIKSDDTKSMERLGQNYGYILYRSILENEYDIENIRLWNANDRANIFVGEESVITLYDTQLNYEKELKIKNCKGKKIDILVENMGRVNFGYRMKRQRKGIDGAVQINGHQHFGWDHYTLALDNIEKLDFSKEYVVGKPAFYKFEFEAIEIGDTYLDFTGFGKGCIFINGFNLGRYWEIGPQKRLYIPGPLILKGRNEIVIFETEGKACEEILLTDKPDIG